MAGLSNLLPSNITHCTAWEDCLSIPRSQCYNGACACIAEFGLVGRNCDVQTGASHAVILAAIINICGSTLLICLHLSALRGRRVPLLSYDSSFTGSSIVALASGAAQMILNVVLSSGKGGSRLYFSSTGLYCLLQVVYSITSFWSVVVVPATWIDAVNRLSLLASERLIPTRAVRLLTPLLAVASLVLGFVMSVALSLEQRVITVLASISYVASIQVLFYVGAQAVLGKKSALRHMLLMLRETYCCCFLLFTDLRISPTEELPPLPYGADLLSLPQQQPRRPRKRLNFRAVTVGFLREPKIVKRRSMHSLLALDRARRANVEAVKYSRPTSLSTINEASGASMCSEASGSFNNSSKSPLASSGSFGSSNKSPLARAMAADLIAANDLGHHGGPEQPRTPIDEPSLPPLVPIDRLGDGQQGPVTLPSLLEQGLTLGDPDLPADLPLDFSSRERAHAETSEARTRRTEDAIALLAVHMWFLSTGLVALQVGVQLLIKAPATAMTAMLLYSAMLFLHICMNTVCLSFCSKKARKLLNTALAILTCDMGDEALLFGGEGRTEPGTRSDSYHRREEPEQQHEQQQYQQQEQRPIPLREFSAMMEAASARLAPPNNVPGLN